MNKLPTKAKQPIVGTLIMITMTMGIPAIAIWQRGSLGLEFWQQWWESVKTIGPYSVALAVLSFFGYSFLTDLLIIQKE